MCSTGRGGGAGHHGGRCQVASRVIGNPESLHEESHSAGNAQLLEYPNYTKPSIWRDRAVPEVLLSGNHALIASWRREKAIERTRATRPDLLDDDIT
nr:hypothetical protein [Tessaracoccus coleopterorum]